MPERFDDALEKLSAAVLLGLVGYGYSFSEHELINEIDCLVKNHRAEILETGQEEFLKKFQVAVERFNKMDVELLQQNILDWDLHVDSYIEENDSVRSVLALLTIGDYRSALDEYLGRISRVIDERCSRGSDFPVSLEDETAELGKLTYNFWLLHRDPVLEHKSVENIFELAIKAQILLDAIKNNDIELVQLMVKSGAYIYMKNYVEGNLLHYACSCNCSYLMMQYLIGLGLDIQLRDCCYYTPLHEAFSRWDESPAIEAARALLEHGAEVNTMKAPEGYIHNTPIICALEYKPDLDGLKLLLRYGADITVVNCFGKNLFEIARESGNEALLNQALQQYANSSDGDVNSLI